ncbi:MAG: ABC transporter ATP-binding protein [Deltaproteobacteria bacterium]|nr:ABC transporter ATP-binding protein [Deltaproteobacteria bacterium]
MAKDLSKSFLSGDAELLILDKLNLTVLPGKSYVILGASGSGKSTLLYLLGGLDRPSSGTVLAEGGKNIFNFTERDLAHWRAQAVGFVFQFHHLLPEFNALENVAMPLMLAGVSVKEAEERALPLLKRVGLGKRLGHRPGILSGGEQQRVALARALVYSPQVLLADEPTGNLDPKNAKLVNDLILELVRENSISAVVVTHNEGLAALLDMRYELRDGKLHNI